jgi:hypothetical protein
MLTPPRVVRTPVGVGTHVSIRCHKEFLAERTRSDDRDVAMCEITLHAAIAYSRTKKGTVTLAGFVDLGRHGFMR